MKQYAVTHYKYDARCNLIEKQLGEQITKFSWDGFNRLSKISSQAGETKYFYDVFGRRIGKENAQGKTEFIWDGDVIALEKTAEHTRHYLFEPNSFVPLAQIVSANDSEQEHTAYYHVDHLGTPQTLSDENGEIAWSAEYKAWGEAKTIISEAAKTAGISNQLRFQGQYADEESGLHYNRHRYYDPEIGRFISSDPIKLAGGSNLHQYAPNPIGWIDPLGLMGDPANATHIAYEGVKDGKPYIGYASKLGLGHSAYDILSYRYPSTGHFDVAPQPFYVGNGQEGKNTARGLEQRVFEDRGGLDGTSNKQNPVGEHNPNRDAYLDAADKHRKNKGCR